MTATRLCTDSSALLPAWLAASLPLEVVPVGVVLDGELHDEPDLDVDAFYARLAVGGRATTSQPSPGRFAAAYAAAAARGAREVISIHVDGRVSGTLGSAELAAREAPLPVRVVDTKTASFGVGICVLAVADAVAGGAPPHEAAEVVAGLVPAIGNVFVAGSAPGGRVPTRTGLPVFSFVQGRSEALAAADSLEDSAAVMAAHVLLQAGPLRAAVGHAHASTAPAADQLARALERSGRVVEVLRYRVGPSVGAHTGPLSFGAFWWPASAGSAPND